MSIASKQYHVYTCDRCAAVRSFDEGEAEPEGWRFAALCVPGQPPSRIALLCPWCVTTYLHWLGQGEPGQGLEDLAEIPGYKSRSGQL